MNKLIFLSLILVSCYSQHKCSDPEDVCIWSIGKFSKYDNQLKWLDSTMYVQLDSYSYDRTWFNYTGYSVAGNHAIGFHIFVDFKKKEVNVFDYNYKEIKWKR